MAGDAFRVPLLLRTVQTLRERFAALRSVGPIAVVLRESPIGTGSQKSLPFEVSDPPPTHYAGWLVKRDGDYVASRDLWFAAEMRERGRFLAVCELANGFVPFVRRKYGLPDGRGAEGAIQRWVWTVFEIAEMRPPFTVLALDRGGVFRYSAEHGYTTTEHSIEAAEKCPDDIGRVLFRRDKFGPERYWQIDDFAEASIAVMDMIEVAIPSLDEETEEGPPAGDEGAKAEGGDEEPEDTTKRDRGAKPKLFRGYPLKETLLANSTNPEWLANWTGPGLEKLTEGTWKARRIQLEETFTLVQEQIEAEKQAEAATKAKQAEEELASRYAEDEDGHGFRVSSTKSGIGQQKTTALERAHERDVAAFLAEAERTENRRK